MARWLGIASLLTAVLLLAAMRAGAEDEFKKKAKIDFEAFFKKLDTNGDGKLSRDEFLKMADRAKDKDREKIRDRLNRVYDKLDADRRGLTKDQFKAFLETRKKTDP